MPSKSEISILEFENYREYLRVVFIERQIKNKTYSLGSFARDLEINKGQLSFILNEKMHISHFGAIRVAFNLKMTTEEIVNFLSKVVLKIEKSEKVTSYATKLLTEKEFNSV